MPTAPACAANSVCFDLVLAQILLVVVPDFFGTAVKAGPSHVVLWLSAIVALLHPAGFGRRSPQPPDAARRRPLRMGAFRLQRSDRISGRLESVALHHVVCRDYWSGNNHLPGLCNTLAGVDGRQQVGCSRGVGGLDRGPNVAGQPWIPHRQVVQQCRQHRRAHHGRRARCTAVCKRMARSGCIVPSFTSGRTIAHAVHAQRLQQDDLRRAQRLRVRRHLRRRIAQSGSQYRALHPDHRAGNRADLHPHDQRNPGVRFSRFGRRHRTDPASSDAWVLEAWAPSSCLLRYSFC